MSEAAKNKFKVGLIQMAVSADPEANVRRAVEFIGEAAGKGADLRAQAEDGDRQAVATSSRAKSRNGRGSCPSAARDSAT